MRENETDTSLKISRRGLIVGGASFAIPAIGPAHVIGKPGRPGANDRIVIGNIGIGGMGRNHVPADTAALCDVDSTRLAEVAKSVMSGGKRTIAKPPEMYCDYRKLLERKDIDAVTIGTPDHWHAMMTIHASQAGKHAYSENPTARLIVEGHPMVNATRRYHRRLQIGAHAP